MNSVETDPGETEIRVLVGFGNMVLVKLSKQTYWRIAGGVFLVEVKNRFAFEEVIFLIHVRPLILHLQLLPNDPGSLHLRLLFLSQKPRLLQLDAKIGLLLINLRPKNHRRNLFIFLLAPPLFLLLEIHSEEAGAVVLLGGILLGVFLGELANCQLELLVGGQSQRSFLVQTLVKNVQLQNFLDRRPVLGIHLQQGFYSLDQNWTEGPGIDQLLLVGLDWLLT